MKNDITLHGIHHITAISSAAKVNVDFYENVLGLKLVKQTVNFDDPYTYHLYYGDDAGRPGTILTFFPWDNMVKGRAGAGMVVAVAFAIPPGSAEHWLERLKGHGLTTSQELRFGERVVRFADPHSLELELIETGTHTSLANVNSLESGVNHAILGLHSATSLVRSANETEKLLVETMALQRYGQEGNRLRFTMNNDVSLGCFYDLLTDAEAPAGRQGTGTVHHIAFRTSSAVEQIHWQQRLRTAGYPVTEVRDRNYFTSIYYHEPGGVLFEIATDPPGFTIDEKYEELGSSLKLPEQYEAIREQITQRLPELRPTEFAHQFVPAESASESDITIVALHGTGGDERDLLPLARRVHPGAALLSPRGKVIEQGMHRFFGRRAPGVFDEQEVISRANELGSFLRRASARYNLTLENFVALGYSNGANIAAALLFLQPELFSRAILLRPMLPLSTVTPQNLAGKEILLMRGKTDRVIPAESTAQLVKLLREAGADLTDIEVDAGHELTETDIDLAGRWITGTTRSTVVQ